MSEAAAMRVVIVLTMTGLCAMTLGTMSAYVSLASPKPSDARLVRE